MTMSLKYTADQVRDREAALIGKGRRPNAWWAWAGPSDCMAAQAYALGIRTNRASSTPYEISIAAFRAHFGWDEVPMSQAKAGMLVCSNWTGAGGGKNVEHIEYIHSIDHAGGTITRDSGNTNAQPGGTDPKKIGFWRKTAALDGHFLFAIVVPTKGAPDTSPYGAKTPTGLAKKDAKLVAAFLNGWAREKHPNLPTTNTAKDGITTDAPKYWTLVQTYGRDTGIYGPRYVVDGDPGPRSRQVEAVILKRAKAAAKR
jgi:hypothetical protein